MFNVDDLAERAFDYRSGRISFDDFEDWFRVHFRGAYEHVDQQVRDVAAAVEAAFSRHYFEGIDEPDFQKELATAVRPFYQIVVSAPAKMIPVGAQPWYARSANVLVPVRLEAPAA